MNLAQAILNHARSQPEAVALIDGDRLVSYRELAATVLRTCSHLASLGVLPGRRVGLRLKETWEHVVALLAVARMGAVAVQIDWRARPAETARIAAALELSLVLVEADDACSLDCRIVALDRAWHQGVSAADLPDGLPSDWGAPFVISQTSGTTGAPKFVQVTHLQYYFATLTLIDFVTLPRRSRYLSTLPLFFSGGLRGCMGHLLRGDCVILYPPLFSAREYLTAATGYRATVGFVVPTVVRQLLEIADGSALLLGGMDALLCTGAPLFPDEKREAARKLTPNFYDQYGTAAIGGISMLRPRDIAERAESVGQPHPLVEIETVDEADRPVPRGAVGRIRCRGPGLGTGISGPSGWESAAEGFHDGWSYTGELAAIDELGYISIKGRVSDVIMSGGAKIYPGEIEAVLQDHPAVAEAAVVGCRTPTNEDAAVAFVVARRGLDVAELIAHCRQRLTSYRIPREIRLVTQLPRNSVGKVNKQDLAKRFAASDRRD